MFLNDKPAVITFATLISHFKKSGKLKELAGLSIVWVFGSTFVGGFSTGAEQKVLLVDN